MYNKIKNFFSGLQLFGQSSADRAVGVDIGSSEIKVVEIRKKRGKAVLETYGAISLGPYAELDAGRVTSLPVEKLTEALKEVLKESGVLTKEAALAIPVQSSLIFSLDLPTGVKETDLKSIIETEARKYIPVPIDEVSLDYFPLPKKEISFEEANNPDLPKVAEEKTRMLVVATQNEAIAKYRSIVSESALSSSFFEIEIFSSIRSVFEHELSPVLLLDFGASRTKLSLVELGMITGFHTINRGGADISESIARSFSIAFSEAEKMKKEFGLFGNPEKKELMGIIKTHIDYILSEANNVLLAYEKKHNRTISKVVLSGGGALLKGVKEAAAGSFGLPVEIAHPFSKVESPAFIEKILDAMGPEFSVALGLALRKLQ